MKKNQIHIHFCPAISTICTSGNRESLKPIKQLHFKNIKSIYKTHLKINFKEVQSENCYTKDIV